MGLSDMNIFISYCWANSDIVNQIDTFCKSYDINIKRDKRDIIYWSSIKDFMKKIRTSDYCILVISDNYLKSKNCMYEVTEVMKDETYKNRIITLVLESAKIFDETNRIKYIEYWEQKYKELNISLATIEAKESTKDILIDLKEIREIQNNIGEFMSLVAQMNNPTTVERFCTAIKNKLFPDQPVRNSEYLIVKSGSRYLKLIFSDISFCESNSKKICICYNSGGSCWINGKTFKKLCEELPENLFVRCHHSFIVNINYISSLELSYKRIIMIGGYYVPISRTYYNSVKKKVFNRYNIF